MVALKRESPLQFDVGPLETEVRNNWNVVLAYENEGAGPWLVDLSHKVRWDLQNGRLDEQKPLDLTIPASPGACSLAGDTLINRMNRTQASIYHLGTTASAMPAFSGYTDVTEATLFLALFGPKALAVAEKVTNLDLTDPAARTPFLLQGPFCHVPCQIVVLERGTDASGGFLLTCSRGYGASMIHAVMRAGTALGLRPAGEKRFSTWIQGLQV
jgi:hypothetical protein